MELPEEQLINEYLISEIIDPCEYDEFTLEKFYEFLGENEGEY